MKTGIGGGDMSEAMGLASGGAGRVGTERGAIGGCRAESWAVSGTELPDAVVWCRERGKRRTARKR
jgi:hypothetical protein